MPATNEAGLYIVPLHTTHISRERSERESQREKDDMFGLQRRRYRERISIERSERESQREKDERDRDLFFNIEIKCPRNISFEDTGNGADVDEVRDHCDLVEFLDNSDRSKCYGFFVSVNVRDKNFSSSPTVLLPKHGADGRYFPSFIQADTFLASWRYCCNLSVRKDKVQARRRMGKPEYSGRGWQYDTPRATEDAFVKAHSVSTL